jgi:hypothetical protein
MYTNYGHCEEGKTSHLNGQMKLKRTSKLLKREYYMRQPIPIFPDFGINLFK